jgi:hypothetical protein
MTQLQLQRNSEIFYSSVDLLNSAPSAMTPSNTWKLDILSGFAVSADSATKQISHNQHGNTIDRSNYSFTVARNPVDWNFSVYLRTTGVERGAAPGGTSLYSTASGNAKPTADWYMWQALVSNTAPASVREQSVWRSQGQLTTAPYTSGIGTHASRSSSAARPEGMLYVKLDNIVYAVSNAIVDSATLTAGIEEIVTVEWTGKGSKIEELIGIYRDRAISVFGGTLNNGSRISANANAAALSRAASYHPYNLMNVAGVVSSVPYIKNRLSAIELSHTLDDTSLGGTSEAQTTNTFVFPVTAFSLEYKNNIDYIIRDQLGSVNNVSTGYSTSRSISGSLSMYLRSGANSSTQFLREIASSEELTTAPRANARIYIGGRTAPYMSAFMPAVHFTYPVISTEDIINLSTNFTAQESYPRASDELTLVATRYGESTSAFALGVWADSGFWSDAAVWSD